MRGAPSCNLSVIGIRRFRPGLVCQHDDDGLLHSQSASLTTQLLGSHIYDVGSPCQIYHRCVFKVYKNVTSASSDKQTARGASRKRLYTTQKPERSTPRGCRGTRFLRATTRSPVLCLTETPRKTKSRVRRMRLAETNLSQSRRTTLPWRSQSTPKTQTTTSRLVI